MRVCLTWVFGVLYSWFWDQMLFVFKPDLLIEQHGIMLTLLLNYWELFDLLQLDRVPSMPELIIHILF